MKCCCLLGHAVPDFTSSADGSPGHIGFKSAEFTGRDRCHPAAPRALGPGAGGVQPGLSAWSAAEHHRGNQPGYFTGEARPCSRLCVSQPGAMTDG